ncbi:MAG: glycosyltransferase [Anaerolineales bacterium]|nr:glycosyltransferase [Anaerolineales bacterium]
MGKSMYMLSIVIPTYNEEKRLQPTILAAIEYLNSRGLIGEIIISDDGSNDETIRIATKLLKNVPSIIITDFTHHGKGWAVRKGVLASRGDMVLFADADLSTPFIMLDSMVPWLLKGYSCVIGIRKKQLFKRYSQPLWRFLLGWGYLHIANFALGISYEDINCGFKIFEGKTARKLFSLQQQWGWEFDAEILFLASRFSFKVKEVPVIWHHKNGSKIDAWNDILRTIFFLGQIRLKIWFNRY